MNNVFHICRYCISKQAQASVWRLADSTGFSKKNASQKLNSKMSEVEMEFRFLWGGILLLLVFTTNTEQFGSLVKMMLFRWNDQRAKKSLFWIYFVVVMIQTN